MTSKMIKGVCVAGLVALSGCASQAPEMESAWPGYRTDSNGNLVTTADGHCWRTNDWTPAMAVPECDVAITGVPQPEPEEAQQLAAESAEQASAEPVALPAPLTIEFAFDSAAISEARQKDLKTWYEIVRDLEGVSVEVDGYSDPIGDDAYNRRLAQQRAVTVAKRWRQWGGDIAISKVAGHGPDSIATGSRCEGLSGDALKDCHQQDRRVVLRLMVTSEN